MAVVQSESERPLYWFDGDEQQAASELPEGGGGAGLKERFLQHSAEVSKAGQPFAGETPEKPRRQFKKIAKDQDVEPTKKPAPKGNSVEDFMQAYNKNNWGEAQKMYEEAERKLQEQRQREYNEVDVADSEPQKRMDGDERPAAPKFLTSLFGPPPFKNTVSQEDLDRRAQRLAGEPRGAGDEGGEPLGPNEQLAGPLVEYRLDQAQLPKNRRGIRYRNSANIDDVSRVIAFFGETIVGVPWCNGWIRAKNRKYLPTHVQNMPVLVRKDALPPKADDDDDDKRDPCRMWDDWEAPRPPRNEEEFQHRAGTGAPWVVLPEACGAEAPEQVAIRAAPSLGAPGQGRRLKGETVELFQWDETKKWRQVMSKNGVCGWMLIDHEKFGPLLRPVDMPFEATPLKAMNVAAWENDCEHLAKWINARKDDSELNGTDAGLQTPLITAAVRGSVDALVLLVKAGADVDLRDRHRRTAFEAAREPARSLLGKLTRQKQDLWSQEELSKAIAQLTPFGRSVLEAMDTEGIRVAGGAGNIPVPHDPRAQAQPGIMHEVVFQGKIAIRIDPRQDARMLRCITHGEVVEVYEFDPTGVWGKVSYGNSKHDVVEGWVQIEDEKHGELLRPVEMDDCV